MEQLKIVDKLTLRQETLRMAVELSKSHPKMVSDTIKNADIFEDYIKGSTDLPEYVDPNADKQQWVDMLNKMREEMKPNPWISVDSEMKPPHDTDILGYENGSTYICKYTDYGEFIINDGCDFYPTHWMPMPIPPYSDLNALGFIKH